MQLLLGIIYVLIIGAVVISIVVLLLRGKKESYNQMYLGCQGMVILWCLSQIMILLSETPKELAFSYGLGNMGVCFVGACWFGFAWLYGNKQFSAGIPFLPFVLSGAHYFLALTNPWHHLYYTIFVQNKVVYGVFFYTNVAETYLFVVAGAVLLYRAMEREKTEEDPMRTETETDTAKHFIIAAVLIPIALNVCYVTGWIQPSFDITPLGFGISGILLLLATIRYRFMEINMEAFDVVLSGLSDGVAIFDRTGRCTFYNSAFEHYIGKSVSYQAEKIRQQIAEMSQIQDSGLQDFAGVSLQPQAGNEHRKENTQVFRDSLGRYLQVQVYQDMVEISMGEVVIGQPMVFVLKDISRYFALLHQSRELAVTNEKLALERERNRIAGQVHDTAGHTLTMIQSYMKLALIAGQKGETQEVQNYLEEAGDLSRQGIQNLRESINQMRREASSELVTQGILHLADQVKEIPVEVTVQGEDSECYTHLSRILYDCVRESITNTLKYADAGKMEIVLRFQESAVELMVADDGRGCENIQSHNGLSGIRERVGGAGGTVKFMTGVEEGFLTLIRLPLSNGSENGRGSIS